MSTYLERKKKALLLGSGQWFLPYGIPWDSCIAAYRFKGASSYNASAHDITEHGYDLSYSGVEFDPAYGLKSGTITQNGLANLNNVVTQVVSFSNYSHSGGTEGRFLITNMKFNSLGIPALGLYMSFPAKDHGGDTEDYLVGNGQWGALLQAYHGSNNGEYNYNRFLLSNEILGNGSSGVVAVDKNNLALWRNGNRVSASVQTATQWDGYPSFLDTEGNNPVNTAYSSPYRGGGSAYIRAAVFFSCSLDNTQHAQLANAILGF